MKEEGFQLIGIKNRVSFQKKFKEMGYLPPIIIIQREKKEKKFKINKKMDTLPS